MHFAGGNCHSFQFLAPLLTDFEVVSPELPGRGRRMEEPLLKSFDLAALDIFEQISNRITDAQFILYGHSMGAYLAFRITNMLERAGRPPAYLLVSGNPGPGVRECKNWHLLQENDFMEELKTLGGIREEFINDRDLRAFFEPILRADFEIAERNQLAADPPVATPLYAMMGSREENVDKITNWGRFTRSGFDHEVMEGDHFFIYKHPQRIVGIIRNCYGRAMIQQQRSLSDRKFYN